MTSDGSSHNSDQQTATILNHQFRGIYGFGSFVHNTHTTGKNLLGSFLAVVEKGCWMKTLETATHTHTHTHRGESKIEAGERHTRAAMAITQSVSNFFPLCVLGKLKGGMEEADGRCWMIMSAGMCLLSKPITDDCVPLTNFHAPQSYV